MFSHHYQLMIITWTFIGILDEEKKYSPKISIIMVVFNEEKTLIKSIQSILSQNFKKYELLIYDNNSSDKTKYFLRKFPIIMKKLKYFFLKKI